MNELVVKNSAKLDVLKDAILQDFSNATDKMIEALEIIGDENIWVEWMHPIMREAGLKLEESKRKCLVGQAKKITEEKNGKAISGRKLAKALNVHPSTIDADVKSAGNPAKTETPTAKPVEEKKKPEQKAQKPNHASVFSGKDSPGYSQCKIKNMEHEGTLGRVLNEVAEEARQWIINYPVYVDTKEKGEKILEDFKAKFGKFTRQGAKNEALKAQKAKKEKVEPDPERKALLDRLQQYGEEAYVPKAPTFESLNMVLTDELADDMINIAKNIPESYAKEEYRILEKFVQKITYVQQILAGKGGAR